MLASLRCSHGNLPSLLEAERIWRFEDDEPPMRIEERRGSRFAREAVIADQMDDEWDVRKRSKPLPSPATAADRSPRPGCPRHSFRLCTSVGASTIKKAMGVRPPPASRLALGVPYLHKAVFRAQPWSPSPLRKMPSFDFNWLTATGTGCFLAAIFSGIILGVKPESWCRFSGTRSIECARDCGHVVLLGLGYRHAISGMDAVLGLAFTRTGLALFRFSGTYIGWLGARDRQRHCSNALFGGLQRITAEQLT